MPSTCVGIFLLFLAPAARGSSWTLSQAVQRGVAVQAQVAASKERASASQDLAKAAQASRLPQLSLRAGSIWSASRENQPLFVSANGRQETIGQLAITAPVIDAQLQALAQAARDSAAAAQIQIALTRLQTAASITNVWFQLALAQEQTTLWQRTAGYDKRLFARTQEAFHAGALARIDVVQTELLLTQARSQLALAKVQQQTERRALNLQLGLGVNANTTIRGNRPPSPAPSVSLSQLWQQMQASQPLLRLAEKEIVVARAEKAVQKAAYLPVLNAQLAYGIDNNGIPHRRDLGWQVGLGLSMPLFGFGRRQAQVAAADANLGAVRADREALLLQMHARLNQDWGVYRRAQENARHAGKIANDAEAVYRMTRKGFHAGAINALNLAQAQNTWIQARLTDVQARLRVELAFKQLLLDTGQLP
ncbi:TolC family protein [Acidithiobacillus sp. IBUN Pt1247-S3]|uniref:TolC family protein n=1 Tax=Acidithiobacillus sp. IBUN Pt1247-S3 TaxID=3166642 RepID=UPI0034E45594